jgi:hypothetical protein
MTITEQANVVLADGPTTDPFDPPKPEFRALFKTIDDEIQEVRLLADAGLKPVFSVRVATTANVSLASGLENGDTIDGVVLVTGDLVQVWMQSSASANGIYVVPASGTASRSGFFNSGDELFAARFFVREGTANGGKTFSVQNSVVPLVGTDGITFAQIDATDTSKPGAIDAMRGSATTIASASSIDIGAASGGDYVPISGTTTVDTLGTIAAGVVRTLLSVNGFTLAASANILTANGEDMLLPAGSAVTLRSQGAGVWRVVSRTYEPELDAIVTDATALRDETEAGFEGQEFAEVPDSALRIPYIRDFLQAWPRQAIWPAIRRL